MLQPFQLPPYFLTLRWESYLFAKSLSPLVIPLRGSLKSPGPADRTFERPQHPWCGAG